MTGEDAICVILANGMLYAPKNEPTATLIQDAFDTAIKALEKQIPKKPIGGVDFAGNEYRICCECSAIVQDGEWKANYCPDCGQALDWSETND